MNAVSVGGVRKRFGKTWVLDGVDLEIELGRVMVLLGPNGAGKSTLLRILAGLMSADGGSVQVLGRPLLLEQNGICKEVLYLPQGASTDPDLSAKENLEFYGGLYGIPAKARAELVSKALAAVGLSGKASVASGKLSGGMRRRLEIARCLLVRPRLLLLDEPTAALDIESRDLLQKLIRTLATEDSVAVLMTTQYPEEAERCGDAYVILSQGKALRRGLLNRDDSGTAQRWEGGLRELYLAAPQGNREQNGPGREPFA